MCREGDHFFSLGDDQSPRVVTPGSRHLLPSALLMSMDFLDDRKSTAKGQARNARVFPSSLFCINKADRAGDPEHL